MLLLQYKTVRRAGAAAPLALAYLLASGSADAAIPPVPESPHGTLVELGVDTSALDEQQARRLHGELSGALSEELKTEGFDVVNDGADARIEATVTLADVDMSTYAIHVDVIVEGQRQTIHEGAECQACNEADIVERSVELIADASASVPLREQEPDPLAEGGALAYEPPAARDQKVSLGVLGFTGVVTIAGGVGVALGGLGLLSVPSDVFLAGSGTTARELAGIAVGVGFSLAGIGLAGLLVDLKVLEPRRLNKRVDVAVDISKTSTGLVVSGRF